MAYKNNAVEEHAFKKIDKEIKAKNLKGLLCFFGKEDFLIKWAIDSIVNKYINSACLEMEYSKLDGTAVTFEQIRNNCETLPFMSEKRVVLVTDLKVLEGNKSKNFTEEDELLLTEYVKNIPESCILIITSETVDKRKKIWKSINEYGAAYDFCELDEKSLKSYIDKKFKAAGKTVKNSVIAQLIEAAGYYDKDTDYTLYNLENDIKKAIAYSENDEIGYKDVENTVSGNIDTNVFAMIDSLGKGDKEEAYNMLHNLLMSGEKEYRLLALLCSHFEIIVSAKEMREEGKSVGEIKDILGIHEFRIKKALTFADKYSLKHLRKILQKAYSIDKSIKTGLLDSSMALELFIAEI